VAQSPRLPLEGEQRRPPAAVFRTKNADAKHRLCARSAADGVTAPKGARCSGIAVHPTPPAGACHRAGHFGPDPLGGRPSPCREG
jgi:hypothetical protein